MQQIVVGALAQAVAIHAKCLSLWQCVLQETALARAEVARINERRQKMQREYQVEKKLVEKMEEALSSAIRVAQRTECVLEELGKMSKSVDELRTSLGID